MSVKKSIVVHDYNPAWASEFETLKAVFVEHVGDDIVDIEHVGSTSIPGLKAKPVIDVDIVVSSTKNCLLYTSPSPRDQRGSRMPSSA